MDIPESFHFSQQRRVEFSDTDMAGIVHFANFLRFVESAEHAFWRHLGRSVHTSSDEGHHGWPRLNVSCSFYSPARFEDLLDVRLTIEELRNSTLRYSFHIFNTEPEVLVASGEVTIIHVALDSNLGRIEKAPIPDDLRKLLDEL